MSGVHRKGRKPETVGRIQDGDAGSLRRSAIFIRGCTEPETVGKFHDGGAERLKRSAVFVRGVHGKCIESETVGKFIVGAQIA